MCSSINFSRFSKWSVKKLHKNCLSYICMDGETIGIKKSQHFMRRTWIWTKKISEKWHNLYQKQILEIAGKWFKSWKYHSKLWKIDFQIFIVSILFIISTWKQIFRGLVLQKYLTHFASNYRFCKTSWTLYGHLRVLFVRLASCACGTSFPIHCSKNQPIPNNRYYREK